VSNSAHRKVILRAYFREISQHLLLVLGGATFLAALAAAVRASSTSQGAPLWISLSLLPLLIANTLPYLIPVALMTAVVICYGRMAADGEATALRAAGISPWVILRPALIAGALVGVLSYPISSQLIPKIYQQIRVLDNRLKVAALENTDPGASGLHFRGLDLSWSRRAADGSFVDVLLTHDDSTGHKAFAFDAYSKKKSTVDSPGRLRLRADRATMNYANGKMEFSFWGMRTLSGDVNSQQSWSMRNSGPAIMRIDLAGIVGELEMPEKGAMYTSSQMLKSLRDPDAKLSDLLEGEFRYNYWRRIITSLATIPMALLGALLGWRMRKGGMLGAFMGTFAVLLLLYYPLFLLADSFYHRAVFSPEISAITPLLGLAVSCIVAYKWQKQC